MSQAILVVGDDPVQRELVAALVARMREAGLDAPLIVAAARASIDSTVSAIRTGTAEMAVRPAQAAIALPQELPRLEPSPAMAGPEGAAAATLLLDAHGQVRPLEEIEGEVIRFAIAHYRGQMSEVARRLRIGRSTLYRKLDGLGLAGEGNKTPENTGAD